MEHSIAAIKIAQKLMWSFEVVSLSESIDPLLQVLPYYYCMVYHLMWKISLEVANTDSYTPIHLPTQMV